MTLNITPARWNATPGLHNPQRSRTLRAPDGPQEERKDSKKDHRRDEGAPEEHERLQAGQHPGRKPGGFSIVV